MQASEKTNLVTVIIPIYKVEQYIHECLDSVINQTYSALEIILVDDGSPDTCPQICDEYAKKDSRIRVIHQANGGLSCARNTALDVAQGKYIVFLDSDDFMDRRLVERTILLMEHNDFDAVVYEAKLVDNESNVTGTRFHIYDEPTEVPCSVALEKIVTDEIGSQVWKAVYRSELWKKIRFPLGRFYEDMPVLYQVYANMSRNVLFLPEQLYYYRLNDNGISLSDNNRDVKSYHIFLGFLDMYTFSQKNANDSVKAVCLANVARAARTVLGQRSISSAFRDHTKQFLKQEKRNILFCKKLSFKEKGKIFLEVYASIIPNTIRKMRASGGK